MNVRSILTCTVFILLVSTRAFTQQSGQEVNVAPNAPKDRSTHIEKNEKQRFDEAIKPYVEKARRTYPEAKERFLKGLPPKHTFFVTTRLYDSAGHFEQVFIAVNQIKDGQIKGLIWSDIQLVSGYKHGDSYTFPESELIDWTISRPDGTEEGNFVGNFLDSYQSQTNAEPTVWRNKPVTPERMNQRIEEAAIKYQSHAPIPLVAFYDIAYPHNDQEYTALDGHAVLLITALAQERGELPIKRVYVSMDGKEIELRLIKVVLSEQSASTVSAKTFGPFRADMLYLLPVYVRLKPADLIAEFGIDKEGFKLTTFGTPVSNEVGRLNIKAPIGAGPSTNFLDEFIKREYPSFFEE
jgi:hypothetical protein